MLNLTDLLFILPTNNKWNRRNVRKCFTDDENPETHDHGHITIPDFGGELYSSLDDEGFLRVCGHARLLLHHKWAENKRRFTVLTLFTSRSRSTAEHSSHWLVVMVQYLAPHHTGWCAGCAGGSCLYLSEPLHCTVLLVAFHYTSWWGGRGGTWLAPPSEAFVVGLDHIRRWPSQPARPVCPADAWSGRDSGLSE